MFVLLVIMVLALAALAYLEFEPNGYFRNKNLSLIRGIIGCLLAFVGFTSLMSGCHVHHYDNGHGYGKSWNTDFHGPVNEMYGFLLLIVLVAQVVISIRAIMHAIPQDQPVDDGTSCICREGRRCRSMPCSSRPQKQQ